MFGAQNYAEQVRRLCSEIVLDAVDDTAGRSMTSPTYPYDLLCSENGCDYNFRVYSLEFMTHALGHVMEAHMRLSHAPANPPRPADDKKSKIEWKDSMSRYNDKPHCMPMSTWLSFVNRLKSFKAADGITGDVGNFKILQLFPGAPAELTDVTTLSMSEEEFLNTLKKAMVVRPNILRARYEWDQLRQMSDETAAAYKERVLACREECQWRLRVDQKVIDISDVLVYTKLFTGLQDPEMRTKIKSRDAMNKEDWDLDMDVSTMYTTIVNEEANLHENRVREHEARVNKATTSEYARQKKFSKSRKPEQNGGNAGSGLHTCPVCKKTGTHKPRDCRSRCKKPCGNKTYHMAGECNKVKNAPMRKDYTSSQEEDEFEEQSGYRVNVVKARVARTSHHEPTRTGEMEKARPTKMPTTTAIISIKQSAYKSANLTTPKIVQPTAVETQAVADTGCEVCLVGMNIFKEMMPPKHSLFKADTNIRLADDETKMSTAGACFMEIIVPTKAGKQVRTTQQVYVMEKPDMELFLSSSALKELNIITRNFPEPMLRSATLNKAPCGCPARADPPTTAPAPACEIMLRNRDKLKQHLLDTFAASTFNQCEHQQLPMMSGEPLRIHIEKDARPVIHHTPAKVPKAWEGLVKNDLERDVALGVIEEVDNNTPTTWCARMHVLEKVPGDPSKGLRRTVDFTGLNKVSLRQAHHTDKPFDQVQEVPKNTLRTVMDAWNGYHSVEIAEEDRHLTTFVTQFGTYRYKAAPQGWKSSGDGYTYRYDKVVKGVEKMVKQIDDTLMWASDIKEAYNETVKYLQLVGKHGIILNKKKFVFAEEEVDFAGFHLTKDGVQPLSKHLDAIRNFPAPRNISDMRSYFAMANQVSYCAPIREILKDFRELLKPDEPGRRFFWSPQLQDLFEKSRIEIVKSATEGVKTFELKRPTVLETDFSKEGLGYWLRQKHCDCVLTDGIITTLKCCREPVWKLVMCGSRFTSGAESNYSAIEGEMCAVAYALKSTATYTLGSDNLTISTDHKPLLAILNGKSLEDITNQRILRLRRKTDRWSFRCIYTKGKDNSGADALSRSPIPEQTSPRLQAILTGGSKKKEFMSFKQVRALTNRTTSRNDGKVAVLTEEKIAEETRRCEKMKKLRKQILEGFPESKNEMPDETADFWAVRKNLEVEGDLILYGHRIVVPASARDEALQHLHGAHQGVTSMLRHAEQTVYWPRMLGDVQLTREKCVHCTRIAPSNSNLPPVKPILATYPMQHICLDYASINGKKYGVLVDRYSNWPEVWDTTVMTLKDFLVAHMRVYGVPESMSTDGGPEFISAEFLDMAARYGIAHRKSSAYNPHANARAEIGVKTIKRMVEKKMRGGDIEGDHFTRAILTYRNTRHAETGISPAEAVFGRQTRGFLPFHRTKNAGEIMKQAEYWKEKMEKRELALEKISEREEERWSRQTKPLHQLESGDNVAVQNGCGNEPKRWDKRGTIINYKGNDQYLVKVDGSGRLTSRNRKHLKRLSDRIIIKHPGPDTEEVALSGQPAGQNPPAGPADQNVHPAEPQSRKEEPTRVEPTATEENVKAVEEESQQNHPDPDPVEREENPPTQPWETVPSRRSQRSTAGKRPGRYADYAMCVRLGGIKGGGGGGEGR